MAILRIILVLIFISPLMISLTGCDDHILDAIHEEEDFIAPFDVVLEDGEDTRTVYFPISDTGNTSSFLDGDDASYTNLPAARSFTETDVSGQHIVTDNVTGLVWTKCTASGITTMKDDCTAPTDSDDAEMSWNAAYEMCKSLRTSKFAGIENWRLPSLPELTSLLYYNGSSYADLVNFPDTEINADSTPTTAAHQPAYWTFSSRVFTGTSYSVTDYGWVVYFNGGPDSFFKFQLTTYIEKLPYNSTTGEINPAKAFVRCVSGGRDPE